MPDVHIITPDEIAAPTPFVDPEGLICGSYTLKDGHVTPRDWVMAYLKGGRSLGLPYRQNPPVARVTRKADG